MSKVRYFCIMNAKKVDYIKEQPDAAYEVSVCDDIIAIPNPETKEEVFQVMMPNVQSQK